MLLTGKVAVIFGGNGVTGNAVAQAMVREETHVCLDARNQGKLDRTANIIRTAGGAAGTFIIDVLDEHNISEEVIHPVERTDGIDVVIDATGSMHEQGRCVSALSSSEFMSGITPFLSTQFNIAKAVTPHMGGNHASVILSVAAPATPMAIPDHLGHIVGCAGTEAPIKAHVSEAGPVNIRIVSMHPHAIVDAAADGPYTGEVFFAKAQSMDLTVDQWLEGAA